MLSALKREKKQQQNSFELRTTVHEAEYDRLKRPPEPEHRFEVTLESNAFTEEKYELFEQYQRIVHKEGPSSISRSGFKRFLCESPIPQTTRTRNEQAQQLGSFHQCYRLDGKLIALGVLDLLPHAVSSVYLIYDVDYEKFSFGKLSALREAALTIEGGYDYYYMGFYIHSCQKMRYKNDYQPQYILDPDTHVWDKLDQEYKTRLDRKGFVSMSRDRAAGMQFRDGEASAVETPESQASSSDIPLQDPKAAQDSDLSAFELGLPGIMTLRELKEQCQGLESSLVKVGPARKPQYAPAMVSDHSCILCIGHW